jgi:uncharacterized membrane protein
VVYSHSPAPRMDAAQQSQHRRAVQVMVVVLVPLAIWTLVGMIVLWPGDASEHITEDPAGYTVSGVTFPRAKITKVTEMSCEGLAGSTPDADSQTCATITADLLEGAERGQSVEVILTAPQYSSGTRVGQTVKLVRIPLNAQAAQYQFSDFERRLPMAVLALLFVAAVVGVARRRGLVSLLGLGFAGFILVKFMFPALISGSNPVAVGLIGSSAIMFVVLSTPPTDPARGQPLPSSARFSA